MLKMLKIKNIAKTINSLLAPLEKMLENKMILAIVNIMIILYAGMIAPQLPNFIANLLKNRMIQISILALIAMVGKNSPSTSLLIAIAFVISMMSLNKLERTKKVILEPS